MTTATLPLPVAAVPRGLALGLAGTIAFGAAAGLGHGLGALARGAWMSPALFLGGALLAAPPLYLASAASGATASAETLLGHLADELGRTGVVLLGLAAPAAFFSATLRTPTAWVLLVGLAALVGGAAVRAVARRALVPSRALWLWSAFALALGVRLLVALSRHLPFAAEVAR